MKRKSLKINAKDNVAVMLEKSFAGDTTEVDGQIIELFRDERDMYSDVEHPELGTVRITNTAIKMSETSPYVRACSPLLGEHNNGVYMALGYSQEEIEALRAEGVI